MRIRKGLFEGDRKAAPSTEDQPRLPPLNRVPGRSSTEDNAPYVKQPQPPADTADAPDNWEREENRAHWADIDAAAAKDRSILFASEQERDEWYQGGGKRKTDQDLLFDTWKLKFGHLLFYGAALCVRILKLSMSASTATYIAF